MAKNEWSPMIELQTGLTDGEETFRYVDIVSEYPSDEPQWIMDWECAPDDHEESDVVVSRDLLDLLLSRGRAHCEACQGCGRA